MPLALCLLLYSHHGHRMRHLVMKVSTNSSYRTQGGLTGSLIRLHTLLSSKLTLATNPLQSNFRQTNRRLHWTQGHATIWACLVVSWGGPMSKQGHTSSLSASSCSTITPSELQTLQPLCPHGVAISPRLFRFRSHKKGGFPYLLVPGCLHDCLPTSRHMLSRASAGVSALSAE